ncbi:ROK family protein [Rothia nasimurium]|uniref:ROK family protein n=1 Tax=Rothia nasimurium TaxID=85336 RepID=UPI00360957EC
MTNQPVALTADLGGTKTALGIVSPTGDVLHRDKIPTQAQAGGTKLAEHTASALADLADLARSRGYQPVGIGIGSAGDPIACDAIALGARAAGIALGDLATILDPHLIVVSGGVVNLGARWWNDMATAYLGAALGQAAETTIVRATLGSDAPLLGAATLIPDFATR